MKNQYNLMHSNHNITTNQNLITSYIHVDSAQRSKYPVNIYADLYNLPEFPIEFTNGSSMIKIHFPDHPFQTDDFVALNNVISKNVILNNVLSVKKNSHFVRIHHLNHGLSLFGLYDPSDPNDFIKIDYVDILPMTYKDTDDIPDTLNQYYILKKNSVIDFKIELSNIKTSLKNTVSSSNSIGNISTNYLNSIHTVYLIFWKNGQTFYHDPNSYLIMLEKRSSINYKDDDSSMTNNIYIKFHNLFGVPLNYLNFGTPINENTKYPYATIISTTKNSFTIDMMFPAIVDPNIIFYDDNDNTNSSSIIEHPNRGGGDQVLMRKVLETKPGYPNPSNYLYKLDKTYKNVISAKIIASVFPNSQRIINNDSSDTINNKLYWRNLDDGEYIYQLSIEPGNYSPLELADAIEKQFNNTIRQPYNNNDSNIIYDNNGYNKYHIVDVNISEITDEVTFSSFGELVEINDPINNPILFVPDTLLEITMNTFPFEIMNSIQTIFLYFSTPVINSHHETILPYAYNNLYRIDSDQNTLSNENDFFNAHLDTRTSILVNFFRNTVSDTINYVKSINTTNVLNNFDYDHSTSIVLKFNHGLNDGDIIVTDQFIDPNIPDKIFIYIVNTVIDANHFIVKKILSKGKYKFIFDDIMINFDDNQNNIIITSITPKSNINNTMRIRHKNHQLKIGDKIILSNSGPINQVPADVINTEHIISKILDDNNYEILLGLYVPISTIDIFNEANIVAIKYPILFQLLFNFPDTLGNLLNFNKIGEDVAVTSFRHTISNKDSYLKDYDFDSLGIEYQNQLKKLNMTGSNYFYITCPQLAIFSNTKPVSNVFSIIRWFDNPGNVIFDSFVPATKYYQPPISTISELEISIRHPDGRMVQFNQIDHSFTIEIVEFYEKLGNTKTRLVQ